MEAWEAKRVKKVVFYETEETKVWCQQLKLKQQVQNLQQFKDADQPWTKLVA